MAGIGEGGNDRSKEQTLNAQRPTLNIQFETRVVSYSGYVVIHYK
jgi:hypothetical protein